MIVSHVIVLFDFIEEMQAEGEPLREALLDAGTVRLRPVLITVGATVLGLFPLASHGGPLWEALCYAQIGGLLVATALTLLLVPVIYAICVLDLRIVKWPGVAERMPQPEPAGVVPHPRHLPTSRAAPHDRRRGGPARVVARGDERPIRNGEIEGGELSGARMSAMKSMTRIEVTVVSSSSPK